MQTTNVGNHLHLKFKLIHNSKNGLLYIQAVVKLAVDDIFL